MSSQFDTANILFKINKLSNSFSTNILSAGVLTSSNAYVRDAFISNGSASFNNNVTIGDSSADKLTITSQVTASNGIFSSKNIAFSSGFGVDFSLTSGQVGGGTINSETLSDYEEGTWTPVLTDFTTTGATTVTGVYRKIGKVVFLLIRIQATTIEATAGTSYINNVPFISTNFSSGFTVVRNSKPAPTSYGIALYAYNGDDIYVPDISDSPSDVVISGFYYAN